MERLESGRGLRSLRLLVVVCAAGWLGAQSDDLAAKSQRAKELMASGRFADAVPLYAELVRALPGEPGLLMNLGMAQHLAGRPREAVAQFEAVLRAQPNHVPALVFLGAARLQMGEAAKAVGPLQKAVQAQPGHRQARQMLADALYSLQRFESAADQYARLARSDPADPRAWFGLGRSYGALAVRAFGELERLAPESAYWLDLVAAARLKQGQYSSAFYLYRQALAKAPEMRGVHAALAEIYRRTGHEDWARVEQERERSLGRPDCAAQKPACAFAARQYPLVLSLTRSEKTAESYYWRCKAYNELSLEALSRLEKLPRSAEFHRLMAEIHRQQGRHPEAAKQWRAALELAPGDREVERELAESLIMSRDFSGARELLERLVARDPDSAELNFLLGDAWLNSQQAEKAVPFLKKAVASAPGLLPAHASLARAYLQIGRGEQAVPHLKAAVAIDDDGSLHYQLARAYQSSGQAELARQAMQKYQEIAKSAAARRQQLEQEIQITPP